MIHRIYSSTSTFKELKFHPGLNILLADKSVGATDKQTRNSAGKTSLIELVHFLMGATCDKESIFRMAALSNHSFGMNFDLKDGPIEVERSGDQHKKVSLSSAGTTKWPVQPTIDSKTDRYVMSNTGWRKVLGSLIFGIDRDTMNGEDESGSTIGGPTFRSLYAYFVRRQQADAFQSATKQASQQQIGDQQIALTYLLDLDWTIPLQWQQVRDRERTLKEVKKAANTGALGSVIESTAELRTQVAVAEQRTQRLRGNISRFQIFPEYRQFEIEASDLNRRLGLLSDDNTIDEQLLAELNRAQLDEPVPEYKHLLQLYQEAGIVLPESITKRFEDVQQFHDSVVLNRRSYLLSEQNAALQRQELRHQEMQILAKRYADVMAILQSHGALEQYALLQAELGRQESDLQSVKQRFSVAQQLESQKGELDMERAQLLMRLRRDFDEQYRKLQHAIVSYEEVSSALYEETGHLTIKESLNGPSFEVTMQGAKSKGISNMQIFCFDMMLIRLASERGLGPGFLIHDSHLFDGVDDRQTAKALQIGAKLSSELGFQYIVTMNSDMLPKQWSDNFSIDKYILPVRLTDMIETGGLFGIRFG